jgi:predicted transcriptional regulator
MQKTLNKPIVRDPEKTARVKKVAQITGVSPRTVYRVIDGDVTTQKREEILSTYMELQEGENEVFENLLIKAVQKAVPF